jgi:hypothetical protein
VMSKLPVLLALTILLAGCGILDSAEKGLAATVATASASADAVIATGVATSTVPTSTTPSTPQVNTPAALLPPPESPSVSIPAPLVAAVLPFAGIIAGLEGAVVAPGYKQAPEIFRDVIALRVDIRDPAALQGDDGIEAVAFQVTREDVNGSSTLIYTKVDATAPYCLFGGNEQACNPIKLVNGAKWPNGTPIIAGNYRIQIDVMADDREKGANWNALLRVELY